MITGTIIKNMFKQLREAQAAVLEAKGSEGEEKAQRQLARITTALQRTILKQKEA